MIFENSLLGFIFLLNNVPYGGESVVAPERLISGIVCTMEHRFRGRWYEDRCSTRLIQFRHREGVGHYGGGLQRFLAVREAGTR